MNDIDAFVFNLTHKYSPSNHDKAIYTYPNGFCFGDWILGIRGDTLNSNNEGGCYTGKDRFYNIEGYCNVQVMAAVQRWKTKVAAAVFFRKDAVNFPVVQPGTAELKFSCG